MVSLPVLEDFEMEIGIMSRPAPGAQTLPLVREAVRRPMIKIAREIGGQIDHFPERRFVNTDGALLLEEAGLLIMGTPMFRPIGGDLVAKIGARHGLNVLLLRFDSYHVSFDLRIRGLHEWLTRYRRWSRGGGLWFVPEDDGGLPYVRATRRGLIISSHAPFGNARQREEGITAANPWPLEWEA